MSGAQSVLEGRADLVAVRVEESALAVDLLLRIADSDGLAEPVTVWVGRPSDRRLAWMAEKHLYEWGAACEPVDVRLELDLSDARAQMAANGTRLTFELIAGAGLPSAHHWG